MKRILFSLLLLPHLAVAQYKTTDFSLNSSDASSIPFKKLIENTNKEVELPLDINEKISGFSISGSLTLGNNKDSYIRILMRDYCGNDFLVYECYPLLLDNKTVIFDNVGIETIELMNIMPKSLSIELNNSSLQIEYVHYQKELEDKEQIAISMEIRRKRQCNYIADMLNNHLKERGMTWRAGVTPISLSTFEEKKGMFGGRVPQMYGFEYYIGGVFVMPNSYEEDKSIKSNSQYVDKWDWRDRHGKNWMTSVKRQQPCATCWAFAALGTLEAYTNLYYNRLYNYDLSEQELLACMDYTCYSRGNSGVALSYVENNGIVEENCFPYSGLDIDSCSNKCQSPLEKIRISNHYNLNYILGENAIKERLFKAPITFGIWSWCHTIVLAGYKTIALGDNIHIPSQDDWVNADSSMVGKTAWLIKNSWGDSWGDNGYAYVVTNQNDLFPMFYLSGNITSLIHSDSDILCEDADGDGYYFWGIGDKPSHCPSWVPDEPDGDDSDINYGPMDEYGFLEQLTCGYTINTPTTYTENQTLSCRLGIVNEGVLTISGTTIMSGDAKIRVCEGGTLIVDGGTIQDANLVLVPGCTVILRNGGVINMAVGKSFEAPVGVIVNIESGEIN